MKKLVDVIQAVTRVKQSDTYGEAMIKGAALGMAVSWVVGTVLDSAERKSKNGQW